MSSKYTESVAHRTAKLEFLSPGIATQSCGECERAWGGHIEPEPDDDGSFSSKQCDICGSTFAGDRYAFHARYSGEHASFDIIHLDGCVDCVLYIANGDEPEEWTQHPRR